MIIDAFTEAASFQKNGNLDQSVAIVNLDEIGLAEGSESMPLKTLHSLIEDGTHSSDQVAQPYQKVGVIGISNWALDPAKLNRGIFVTRGEPDINELIESAKGICNYDQQIYKSIEPYINQIAEAYLELCQESKKKIREFFGLRDFYSLMKMIYWFCSSDAKFTWNKLEHAVRRNFSGLNIDPVEPFKNLLFTKLTEQSTKDPNNQPMDIIQSALKSDNSDSISRYLLLITENNAIVDIIQSFLSSILNVPESKILVIFGSSFRNDLQYTEVCKNINRIKQAMELGNTVILLNSFNLYESLYDALNQYYQVFGGQRYVYLGLGTHRVNCLVHDDFRLIIISDRDSVYDTKRFPIPLINRLEKHILSSSIMLNAEYNAIVSDVLSWLKSICAVSTPNNKTVMNDLFIGYSEDTIATIVLNLCKENISLVDVDEMREINRDEIIAKTVRLLLRCASADSIVRISSNKNRRSDLIGDLCLWTEYFEKQKHNSLRELIEQHIKSVNVNEVDLNKNLIQITTHSKLNLSRNHIQQLSSTLEFKNNIESCKLESFETSQQFEDKIKGFVKKNKDNLDEKNILLIQCNLTECMYYDLLSCARFTIVEQFKEYAQCKNIYIVLLINLNRSKANKFIGFQVGHWACYHLDEIDDSIEYLPSFQYLKGKSLSQLLEDSVNNSIPANQTLNISLFMKSISYYSCSLIVDTNVSRTIKRVEMFLKLCDDERFFKAICSCLIKLQREKEENNMTEDMAKNWLIKEAASLKSINQNYTLKKSCKNYIEAKLSPLLGFLISKIDLYSNLDIYFNAIQNNEIKWRSDLWLEILSNEDLFKISYMDMRTKDSDNNETELNVFACNSKLNEENQTLSQNLPFFWILVQQLNDLVENFNYSYNLNQSSLSNSEASDESDAKISTFMKTIPKFFEGTANFKVVTPTFIKKSTEILDLYISDFILYNCDVKTEKEVKIIARLLNKKINDSKVNRAHFKIAMPLVHYHFEMISKNIYEYLKFSNFMPSINDRLENNANISHIDLRACLTCIESYEKKLENSDLEKSTKDLDGLIKLVQNVLVKNPSVEIEKKYFALIFLKLFYQNILSYNNSQKDFLNTLINILKIKYLRDMDFRNKNTIESIHEFILKAINKTNEYLFKENTVSNCCNVKCKRFRIIYTDNCSCLVCEDCEKIMASRLVNMKTTCLSCKKEIIVKRDANNRISYGLNDKQELSICYKQFIESLNAFYFAIVEFLILKDNKDATKESILRAISHGEIQKESLNLAINYNCRSSITEMLLNNSNEYTLKFLNSWFKQASFSPSNFKASTEMALITDSCVQDILNEKLIKNDLDYEINYAISTSQELINGRKNISYIFDSKAARGREYSIEHLIYLVKFKICLKILAKFNCGNVNMKSSKLKDHVAKFYENIKELLAQTGTNDTLYNYLIKQIIRKYGYSSLKQIKNDANLNWMTPEHIIGDDSNVTDKYILIQGNYVDIRNAINDCVQNNLTSLEAILKKNINFAYVCMALYKNVSFIYKDQDVPVTTKNNFNSILNKYQASNRHHWQQLVENSFSDNLKVNKENWKHIDMNLLLVQMKYSILFSNSRLIKPLAELINSPRQFANSFIPGMPQDSVYDIQMAIRAAHPNENPTFYLCPNDHMYVLFDCGRPWVKTNCKTCGAEIGGTNHQLLANNRTLKIEDKTLRGYCLPDASNSTSTDNAPKNDGVLNLSGLHTVRFVINCCLYFSCDVNDQEVSDLMSVKTAQRKTFFWNHMKNDLSIISRLLNINMDDAMILMHLMCDFILKNTIMYDFKWNTKEERKLWEQQFYEQFCSKFYKDTASALNVARNKLKENTSAQETHKVYFMAYEFNDDNKISENLYENANFWKYKPEINIDIMSIQLKNQTNSEQFVKLKKFIEMRDKIAILSNLADIIKFVNFLQNFFYKSLFKHYAQTVTMREILEKKLFPKNWSNERVRESITTMRNAWNSLRQLVVDTTILNSNKLNPKFDYEFSMDSKLTFFLPTQYGDGFTCYKLIQNLCEIQNEILKFCFDSRIIENEKVDLQQLEINDNVIYYEEAQLANIIKSNYTYDSKESKLNFNFDNITNLVIQKILRDKPLIDLKSFKFYEYADEINDFDLFNKISDIIKQEPLNSAIQTKIFNEFNTSNEASEALSILKIIINYAKTANSSPDEYINNFIEKIYVESSWKTAKSTLKFSIIENCQLKHLKNSWILLMIKKTFMNSENEAPFENLNNEFKNITETINDVLTNPNPSLILSYCVIIFQIIEFYFITLSNDECSIMSSYKIKEFVETSLDSLGVLLPENIEALMESIPEDHKMKSVFTIWLKTAELLK